MIHPAFHAAGDGVARRLYGGVQLLHPPLNLFLGAYRAQDQKFVAAQPEHMGLGELLDAGLRHEPEHFVTGGMTQPVIQLMQAVHIDIDDGQANEGAGVGFLHEAGIGGAVLQAGGRVHEAGLAKLHLGIQQAIPVKNQLPDAVKGHDAVDEVQHREAITHGLGIGKAYKTPEGAVEGEKQQQQEIDAQDQSLFQVDHGHEQKGDKDYPQKGKAIVSAKKNVAGKEQQKKPEESILQNLNVLILPALVQIQPQNTGAAQGGDQHPVGMLENVGKTHQQEGGNGKEGQYLQLLPPLRTLRLLDFLISGKKLR